ncbi:hypothetical protein [Lactococcus lactis]|uniref:hypothetical protein n=1 Tax=Lactococcus lactis TaxID=1358 RepID=UPI0024A8175E|nr:hypothetical protein [Lactococcus lactis]
MKAYYLSVEGRDEAGGVIVFAENYNQAIGNWDCELEYERWIDRRCKRAPEFDGMENASHYEMTLKQWHEGWWFDTEVRCPWEGEATDEDFKKWYEEEYQDD